MGEKKKNTRLGFSANGNLQMMKGREHLGEKSGFLHKGGKKESEKKGTCSVETTVEGKRKNKQQNLD